MNTNMEMNPKAFERKKYNSAGYEQFKRSENQEIRDSNRGRG